MQAHEATAIGELAGRAMAGTVSLAEDLHRAIFKRAAVAGGPPVKLIHDGVAGVTYKGARRLHRALGQAGGAGLAIARAGDRTRLADSPGGGLALGVLSGFQGDRLRGEQSALAIEMSIRQGRADVAIDRPGLATAFPRAASRLAIFIHGLCETDEAWRMFGDPARPYGSRLERDLGFTPLYLRYNSGLHISDNGRQLSRLLAAVLASWPTEVEELVLIGHSMGGLVARSACRYGELAEEPWVADVRHVFCLASPHLGAPLEKAANVGGWALGRLPETRPLARIVNGRSEGIKDLRFGYLVDEDWEGRDPDALLDDNRHHIPFLETANHYYVGATLTRDRHHPLGHLVGDLLVRLPSASGECTRGERIPFEIDNGHHAGGLTHFHVLNDPDVYRQIRRWLERDSLGPGTPELAPDRLGGRWTEPDRRQYLRDRDSYRHAQGRSSSP
jgi:pimeloyl-ACP methyl ester carboxylesterase